MDRGVYMAAYRRELVGLEEIDLGREARYLEKIEIPIDREIERIKVY